VEPSFQISIATLSPRLRAKVGAPASLTFHVFNVVGLRAEEQMIGIYTWRIIAGMKHLHPFGDFAFFEQPHDPVRFGFPGEQSSTESLAVTILVAVSQPGPTLIQASNLKLLRKQFDGFSHQLSP
jgi:hypothetical protein